MGMKPRHQVSKAAVELIKRFEGYRSKAAQLPDGRWTIGFGHTLTAREGAQVSEQDAEALLLYDLIGVAHAVNEQTFTPLTQNQFDSLCCFAFNVGLDNFKRSSVLRRINEGSMLQAACAMEMWRKADFEGERIVVDALVRRRSAEKTLFLTPAGGWVPAPSPIVRPKVDYDAVNFVPRQTPTTLNAPMTGDKAVVERDGPAPVAAIPPVTAAMAAAAAVTSRLAELVPEPVVVRPGPVPEAPPEPIFAASAEPVSVQAERLTEPETPVAEAPPEPEKAVAEAAPQPEPTPVFEPAASQPQPIEMTAYEPVAIPAASELADRGPAWSPSLVAEPAHAEEDDAFATAEEPVLEITATPAVPTPAPAADALAFPPPPAPPQALPDHPESYTPYPATPVLAVGNGDRAFILTPSPDFEASPEEEATSSFQIPVPANESEPGLFDMSSLPLVSEDHVRRLVAEDELRLASNFDADFDAAPLEQARIVGLPWLGAAVVGAMVCGGGVVWGYLDHTGNGLTTVIAWGLGITGGGVFLFSAWRWLDGLGMPRLDDEDEADHPA
jgi:lysozyme